MGWVFDDAPRTGFAYPSPQHLDPVTIEGMTGQHDILFLWLRPSLTILLILWNVMTSA